MRREGSVPQNPALKMLNAPLCLLACSRLYRFCFVSKKNDFLLRLDMRSPVSGNRNWKVFEKCELKDAKMLRNSCASWSRRQSNAFQVEPIQQTKLQKVPHSPRCCEWQDHKDGCIPLIYISQEPWCQQSMCAFVCGRGQEGDFS